MINVADKYRVSAIQHEPTGMVVIVVEGTNLELRMSQETAELLVDAIQTEMHIRKQDHPTINHMHCPTCSGGVYTAK